MGCYKYIGRSTEVINLFITLFGITPWDESDKIIIDLNKIVVSLIFVNDTSNGITAEKNNVITTSFPQINIWIICLK